MKDKRKLLAQVVAASMSLALAVATIACTNTPQVITATGQQEKDNLPALKPKEGLTFTYRSQACGANTNGRAPSISTLTIEVSDGSTILGREYQFKQQEYAEEFYSDKLSHARAVLQNQSKVEGASHGVAKRAVVVPASGSEENQGAILTLQSRLVYEITGSSVGHVLAYEKWRDAR